MKHTPGPWEYCAIKTDQYSEHSGPYGAHEDCIKIGERVLRISCFTYPGSFVGAEEWGANAHIIAAAPELLEALREMLKAYDDEDYYNDIVADKARAVIAKAEGR